MKCVAFVGEIPQKPPSLFHLNSLHLYNAHCGFPSVDSLEPIPGGDQRTYSIHRAPFLVTPYTLLGHTDTHTHFTCVYFN